MTGHFSRYSLTFPGERAHDSHWIGGWGKPRPSLDILVKKKSLTPAGKSRKNFEISDHVPVNKEDFTILALINRDVKNILGALWTLRTDYLYVYVYSKEFSLLIFVFLSENLHHSISQEMSVWEMLICSQVYIKTTRFPSNKTQFYLKSICAFSCALYVWAISQAIIRHVNAKIL